MSVIVLCGMRGYAADIRRGPDFSATPVILNVPQTHGGASWVAVLFRAQLDEARSDVAETSATTPFLGSLEEQGSMNSLVDAGLGQSGLNGIPSGDEDSWAVLKSSPTGASETRTERAASGEDQAGVPKVSDPDGTTNAAVADPNAVAPELRIVSADFAIPSDADTSPQNNSDSESETVNLGGEGGQKVPEPPTLLLVAAAFAIPALRRSRE